VVRRIADTLDAHGVPEAVVVGHSLGGIVAVEYARANPDRARARARAAVNLDGFWWGREFPGAERVSEGLLASAGTIAPPEYVEQQVMNFCPTAGGRRCRNGRRCWGSRTNSTG
jgi:pimeloyl-ACP methyl ester carboxylesterase